MTDKKTKVRVGMSTEELSNYLTKRSQDNHGLTANEKFVPDDVVIEGSVTVIEGTIQDAS